MFADWENRRNPEGSYHICQQMASVAKRKRQKHELQFLQQETSD